ncbi:MAG TPA: hypothetical protein VJ806_08275 [Luteimonas sp.]|nr:hypothetical protein [Luteimonas sp.]
MNKDSAIRIKWAAAMLALASVLPLPALAQQRSFVNLGFEQPALTGSSCYLIFSATAVDGWVTNHTNNVVQGSCTLAGFPTGSAITQPIEFWRGPNFGGVPPRAGNQHAELNAYEASRLSQTICLTPGEQIDWRLSHRGRNSATVPDTMSFNIDSTANAVAVLATTTNGGGLAPLCPDSGGVDNLSCAFAAGPNGWRDYSGSFIWNGSAGNHNFGFQATDGVGSGNFLDEIQVTLRPYVEFSASGFSAREGQALAVPQIRISGTVPAGGISVLATISGGTATLGTDYTTASATATVNISVPAGVYDNSLFNVPISGIVNDAIVENNETVTIALQPSAANYTLSSTATCGGAPTTTATLTILDNDVDVRTTKSVNTATPAPGGNAVFTVTYQNNTARPTVGDTTMHDAAVTLADALPAGFTAFSWTCAASGTPAPACPAASGSGPVNTPATLPAGNSGNAGGTLTYTITGAIAATQCASTTNTSTVTANAPVQEATSSQSGFDTPIPGGTANNTATASVDPLCSDLAIFKTNTPAAGPSDQAADTVVSGTATTYSLRVVNIGPDAVTNARVTDTPGIGLTCPGALGSTVVTCTPTSSPAGATICPAAGVLTTTNLFGAGGITIPSIAVSPTPSAPNNFVTLTFTCTVN